MTEHAQHGKPEWITAALDRFEGPLLRYARRLVGDAELARDIVQETFLRLCRQDPATLDGHMTEWLYTVCRNRAFDIRRKERRMTTMAEAGDVHVESPQPSPADLAEQHDTNGHVISLIGELPENQQEVLRLKFQTGLSYREIAGVTGLSVTNVGYLIHRGLRTLRLRLKRQFL